MSGTLRISICDPNENSRENLKKYLIGMEKVWLEADCSRYEFFIEIVQQTNPDVAIIDLDSNDQSALSLLENMAKTFPDVSVIAVSSRSDGQLILGAMRAGAREFLNSPIQIDELVGALDRVSSSIVGDGKSNKSGTVISVCGASGGVGTTTFAVNFACALAHNADNSVVVIDLDLSLGDADVFLDMIPDYTLLDVAQNITRLDLALLRKSLTKHESGVYLLPRPVQLDDLETISAEDFKKVIGLLKASFSHLVIDLSKAYSSLDITALKASDEIMLLTQLDLPCLRNVVRLMTSLELYDDVSEKVRIVVNRTGLDKQISASKAEETIDREIYWRIPNDYSAVSESRNNGVPLLQQSPKAAITQSLQGLADKLSNTNTLFGEMESGEEGGDKKSWLNFLSKSKP
ncbi:MAG: response regulator [Planctomycetota bacterium]